MAEQGLESKSFGAPASSLLVFYHALLLVVSYLCVVF